MSAMLFNSTRQIGVPWVPTSTNFDLQQNASFVFVLQKFESIFSDCHRWKFYKFETSIGKNGCDFFEPRLVHDHRPLSDGCWALLVHHSESGLWSLSFIGLFSEIHKIIQEFRWHLHIQDFWIWMHRFYKNYNCFMIRWVQNSKNSSCLFCSPSLNRIIWRTWRVMPSVWDPKNLGVLLEVPWHQGSRTLPNNLVRPLALYFLMALQIGCHHSILYGFKKANQIWLLPIRHPRQKLMDVREKCRVTRWHCLSSIIQFGLVVWALNWIPVCILVAAHLTRHISSSPLLWLLLPEWFCSFSFIDDKKDWIHTECIGEYHEHRSKSSKTSNRRSKVEELRPR